MVLFSDKEVGIIRKKTFKKPFVLITTFLKQMTKVIDPITQTEMKES